MLSSIALQNYSKPEQHYNNITVALEPEQHYNHNCITVALQPEQNYNYNSITSYSCKQNQRYSRVNQNGRRFGIISDSSQDKHNQRQTAQLGHKLELHQGQFQIREKWETKSMDNKGKIPSRRSRPPPQSPKPQSPLLKQTTTMPSHSLHFPFRNQNFTKVSISDQEKKWETKSMDDRWKILSRRRRLTLSTSLFRNAIYLHLLCLNPI